MPCERRGNAIVCSRGVRPIVCSVCGRKGDKLCDFPLEGAGKTCDRPLCKLCAVHVDPDLDYCPAHARLKGLAQQLTRLNGEPHDSMSRPALTPECFDGLHSACDSDACGCPCHHPDEVPEFEPYNDSDGEPDFTLEDDEEFEESMAKAMRWPEP